MKSYADEKQLIKEGRHVGLDFYDLLIEGDYTHRPGHGTPSRPKDYFPPLSARSTGMSQGGFSLGGGRVPASLFHKRRKSRGGNQHRCAQPIVRDSLFPS